MNLTIIMCIQLMSAASAALTAMAVHFVMIKDSDCGFTTTKKEYILISGAVYAMALMVLSCNITESVVVCLGLVLLCAYLAVSSYTDIKTKNIYPYGYIIMLAGIIGLASKRPTDIKTIIITLLGYVIIIISMMLIGGMGGGDCEIFVATSFFLYGRGMNKNGNSGGLEILMLHMGLTMFLFSAVYIKELRLPKSERKTNPLAPEIAISAFIMLLIG